MPTVRRATSDDAAVCAAIMRGLPDHFSDDVAAGIGAELPASTWVIEVAEPVGFAVVEHRGRSAEILWIAVAAGCRGRGIGTILLDQVLAELAGDGVSVVEAKTLDRSVDYAPYDATRAFWDRSGFVQIDTIDPLPGWQPGNPAAIYVAALATTRQPQD